MDQDIPQYSTFSLRFENISYLTSNNPVKLNDVEDFILAIEYKKIGSGHILRLKYSENPGRFKIDVVNNSVEVSVTEPSVTGTVGRYYVNLWLITGANSITHLTQSFTIVKAVGFN